MVEHVHCEECRQAIYETHENAKGETVPTEIHTGTILRPHLVGNRVEFAEVAVPICQRCFQTIAARQRLTVMPPALIVPSGNGNQTPDLK